MDSVDPAGGVFITAEGLLMYLQPEHALGLIDQCAKRFPDGRLLDLPPPFVSVWSRLGIRTSLRYRIPEMPFNISVARTASVFDLLEFG